MTEATKIDAAKSAFSNLSFLALARANIYRLLADAFYNPSPEFVHNLISGAYLSELNGYQSDLLKHQNGGNEPLDELKKYITSLAGADVDETLKEMKVEYARLFIGPGKPAVQPYETFYDKRMSPLTQPLLMVSPAAMAVEKIYRQAGVAMSHDLQEPSDHFAVELEFLFFLSKKESDAWAEGDNKNGNEWHRQELAFIDGHLGVWGLEFCDLVIKASTHPFYRALCHFARTFIYQSASHSLPGRPG